MPKISIIVPVYNIEQYLEQCINSLISQTYKNIEILLIDDGSSDNSGNICDKFSKQYKNIITYHKKNGGLSSARNLGITKASGEFVSFVDGDDFVNDDFIESMYLNIKKYNTSISGCGYFNFYSCSGKIENVLFDNIEKFYNKNESLKYLNITGYFNISCCNKLFKKSLFENIKFPIGRTSEDAFIIHELLYSSGGIFYSSTPKYFYRQRPGSITRNSKINYDIIDAIKSAIQFYENKHLYQILPFAYQLLVFSYIGIYDNIICRNIDRKNQQQIKKAARYYYKFSSMEGVSILRKIQALLFIHTNQCYKIFFKFYTYIRNQKNSKYEK